MKGPFRTTLYPICILALWLLGTERSLADPSTNGSVVVTVWGSQTILSSPVWTNGQFQFSLETALSDVNYVVESSPDLVNWMPIATNMNTPVITVPAPGNVNFFRVNRSPVPLFAYAVATLGTINLYGHTIYTDSYNSTNGPYGTGPTGTNGDVASQEGILNVGRGTINGNVYLGPDASFQPGTNVTVNGTVYYDYNFQFPDAVLPSIGTNGSSIAWLPATTLNGTNVFGVASGTNFSYVSGYYIIYSSVNNSKPIYVAPGQTVPVQIIIANFSPSSVTIDGGLTNSGTLILYQDSGAATLGGNSLGGSIGNRPQNFIYVGLPGVTSVTLTGTAEFVGLIYAPDANLFLNGGYANNIFGSCIVGSLTVNAHWGFHFDESLLSSGPFY